MSSKFKKTKNKSKNNNVCVGLTIGDYKYKEFTNNQNGTFIVDDFYAATLSEKCISVIASIYSYRNKMYDFIPLKFWDKDFVEECLNLGCVFLDNDRTLKVEKHYHDDDSDSDIVMFCHDYLDSEDKYYKKILNMYNKIHSLQNVNTANKYLLSEQKRWSGYLDLLDKEITNSIVLKYNRMNPDCLFIDYDFNRLFSDKNAISDEKQNEIKFMVASLNKIINERIGGLNI